MRQRYDVGDSVDDLCPMCKVSCPHMVAVADGDDRVLYARCDTCGTEHRYSRRTEELAAAEPPPRPSRSGSRSLARPAAPPTPMPLVSERERRYPVVTEPRGEDLELMLRRVFREELGITTVVPADKWRDGELVLRPGREGLQEKTWPIESFFSKIISIRNRLRVLEQNVNGADVPSELKLKLQGYITACYGSLTSFNVLFAEPEDRIKGSGGDAEP